MEKSNLEIMLGHIREGLDELTEEDFNFFWMCFTVGFNDLKKEESDMDG